MEIKEIWKDVKDYEGLYQVSNLGRVKSLERKHGFQYLYLKIQNNFMRCLRNYKIN